MSAGRIQLATAADVGAAPLAAVNAQKGVANGLAKLDLRAKLHPDNVSDRQPILESMMSFRKGGIVGTSGRTPIAFRFDDSQIDVRDYTGPLFWARNIPASIALCTALTEPWQNATLAGNGAFDYRGRGAITWATLQDWNYNKGFEFWAHGRTHQPPHTGGAVDYTKLVDEIVNPLDDFAANNIMCMGWTKPGVSDPGYGSYFVAPEDWRTWGGRLLTDHYALTETDMTGTFRHVPSAARHGLAHTTITDGMSYATAVGLLNAAIDGNRGLEIMLHSANVVNPATGLTLGGAAPDVNMTLTEIAAFLDYVVTLRDAGTIEILTPSSLAYADPSSTHRLDLIGNGDFERAIPSGADGTLYNWAGISSGASVVTVGDAHSGTKVMRLTGAGSPFQIEDQMSPRRGMAGQTYMFDGWCRALPAGGASVADAQVTEQDSQNTAKWTLTRLFRVSTTWTRVRFPFTPPPDTVKLTTRIARSTAAGAGVSTQVEWDDVHVYVA